MDIMMDLTDILAAGILLTSLMAMTTSRMRQLLRYFQVQSSLLALMVLILGIYNENMELCIISGLTVLVKVLFIPRVLLYTMDRINVRREVEPLLGIPGSLLVSAIMILMAYYVTEPLNAIMTTMTRNCLTFSFSVVLIGLLMMVTRRKAMTEIIGMVMMENGLFLAVTSVSQGMPLMVEMGIFFDMLVAVIIMGIFVFRINETFDSLDTRLLRRLRD